MKILPCLFSDSYKQFHAFMYPKNMTLLFSNETPRNSRLGTKKAVFFGLQYYIKERLINYWNEQFFDAEWSKIEKELKRFHKHFSGVDFICDHWKKLHNLGYLPLCIRALPEGSVVPMRVPFFVIYNVHEDFGWLVNFLETDISIGTWDFCVNATIAKQYRELLDKHALETTGSTDFVQWQAHDFSMRGRPSFDTSYNQAGHLLSFTGTDAIPAVLFLEKHYNANMENELIGGSVPATEHSVMMCAGKKDEIGTFEQLLNDFPTGILSVVSDTWDLWKVCTEYLPALKDKILARNGKLVIRPDSGDPVDIICGFEKYKYEQQMGGHYYNGNKLEGNIEAQYKGVIELLWDVFGGTINEQGYKVLDPHIGAIYGDSITLDRAQEICKRLKTKGFASTNIVLGVGSYTYNYNTRDSLGIAIKATYCEVSEYNTEPGRYDKFIITGRKIFKDPITDDGTKKSAKGLLAVFKDDKGEYYLKDQATWNEVMDCEFNVVFINSEVRNQQSLSEIRERLKNKSVY